MKVVKRYEIPNSESFCISLPIEAQILKFVIENKKFYICVLENAKEKIFENRCFELLVEGVPMNSLKNLTYIGSSSLYDLNFYLFESIN